RAACYPALIPCISMYLLIVILSSLLLSPAAARAQGTGVAPQAPGSAPVSPPAPAPAPLLGMFKKATQWRLEQISPNHLRLTGQVEIEGDGVKFFADAVDLYTDQNRLVA